MTPKIIRSAEGQSLMGGRQTIKLKSEDTDGKLSVILSVVQAGSGIPVHIHQHEDETFQVADGELEVTLNGEVSILKKGDMVLMPKNISHGFNAIKDTTIWVSLVPGGGEKMFVELAKFPPGPPNMKLVAEICERYGVTFIQN